MTLRPFSLPWEVFTDVELPNNVKRAAWLDNMRLTRYARRLHQTMQARALAGRGHKCEGSFSYHGRKGTQRVRFDGRNGQFHALYEHYYQRGYEPETAFLLLRLATDFAVFYDIGANWGYFALLIAASPLHRGPIFAFEPNPPVFVDLQRTINDAGVQDRVTALPIGIGRGVAEMHVVAENRFKSGEARLVAEGSGTRVAIKPIDQLELPPPSIVKIDAEGMELDILEGASATLTAHRPHVIFENFLNFAQPEVTRAPLSFLLRHGYHLFNPALAFPSPTGAVFASYGAPMMQLLEREPRPRTALVPVTTANRFVMSPQLNIFACHATRLHELPADEFINVPVS